MDRITKFIKKVSDEILFFRTLKIINLLYLYLLNRMGCTKNGGQFIVRGQSAIFAVVTRRNFPHTLYERITDFTYFAYYI